MSVVSVMVIITNIFDECGVSDGDYHQHLCGCQCLRSDMIWKSLRLSFLLTVIIETIMVAKKVYDKNILKKVSNNWLSWLSLISSLKFNLGGRHQTPPPLISFPRHLATIFITIIIFYTTSIIVITTVIIMGMVISFGEIIITTSLSYQSLLGQ